MTDDAEQVMDYYERRRQEKVRIAEARTEQEKAVREAREKKQSDGVRNIGRKWHPGALDD